jgi:hypothetical protein
MEGGKEYFLYYKGTDQIPAVSDREIMKVGSGVGALFLSGATTALTPDQHNKTELWYGNNGTKCVGCAEVWIRRQT